MEERDGSLTIYKRVKFPCYSSSNRTETARQRKTLEDIVQSLLISAKTSQVETFKNRQQTFGYY